LKPKGFPLRRCHLCGGSTGSGKGFASQLMVVSELLVDREMFLTSIQTRKVYPC